MSYLNFSTCNSVAEQVCKNDDGHHLCCLQAIEELNIKQKFWKDLLTDQPFTRKDIIHLQDPLNLTVCCF